MISAPASFVQAKDTLHSAYSWVELWKIQLDATHGLFVTSYTSAVTWNGQTFSRASIEREAEERSSDRNIPTLRIKVGNVDRQAATLLRTYAISGMKVWKYLVNSNLVGDASQVITERYTILEAEVSDLYAMFTLGIALPTQLPFPARRFQRNRCDAIYGSDLCGYDITRSGAIATCDFTYLGANGCVVHGTDEVAAGRPRMHALNFQGEPSIPKGPYL